MKKCKYPVIMNKHRRAFLKKLRIFHFIFALFMMISAFFPKKYLNYSFLIWTGTILVNFFFAGDFSHCWIQYLEWRNSNCENYSVLQEILKLFSIDEEYSKLATRLLYIIFISIILIRIYIHGITF